MIPVARLLPRVALIGNPNTGKTSLFNALTGLAQRVGNYPGVTVDVKSGRVGDDFEVVDLPGTYSLAAQSPDEMVAIDLILGRMPSERRAELVVVIVDASNLARNLYLATQVIELGLPTVVALNMTDVAERHGIRIDTAALAERIGVPVVPIVASKGKGIGTLRRTVLERMGGTPASPRWVWEPSIERETERLRDRYRENAFLTRRALIDEGGCTEKEFLDARNGEALEELCVARDRIRAAGRSPAAFEAHMRYAWIREALAPPVVARHPTTPTPSQWIDRFLTHRLIGLLVFVVIMGAVFVSVFQLAVPFMGWIGAAFDAAAAILDRGFAGTPLEGGILHSLLVDGVIAGVGAVLSFLPQIALLFLFISILEDCGYMARSAFLMDRVLRFCGLSGHSFIPMLGSFACAVPGVMASRTIRNRRDRITTILVAPLMSCSARIPVYAVMIAAFVPSTMVAGFVPLQGTVFVALYFLGILVAIPVALTLKWTVLRGESSTFVMELPPYRIPQLRAVGLRVLQSLRAFLQQAGSIIFAMSIVIWALGSFPRSAEVTRAFEVEREAARVAYSGPALEGRLADLDRAESAERLRQSFLGRMGRSLEPVVAPLGWDWTIGMSALAAFPARELLVSTLNIVYGLGDGEGSGDASGPLVERLHAARRPDGSPVFTLPVALSILVFIALCCQCASTLAVMRRETASWRWPILAFTYMTALAYGGAFVTFQIATFAGL